MTTGQGKPPRMAVEADPGSRLEQLLAAYGPAKAAAEEAKNRFESITAAIKAEATAASPGAMSVAVSGSPGLPRLAVTWHEGAWRLDAARMKEESPLLYVQYAKQGKGFWEVRAL